jgi:hypothetical protein
MANRITNLLANFGTQLLNTGQLKDHQHAARLFVDDTFRLAPKTRFLYHVVFEKNQAVKMPQGFTPEKLIQVGKLVKRIDLPKYSIGAETKNQYNKKTNIHTTINYDPINVTLHDDRDNTVTAFWQNYYAHYFRDTLYAPTTYSKQISPYEDQIRYRFGLDNDLTQSTTNFLSAIKIYQLHDQKFTQYTLLNPIITSFSHDTMDAGDGAGIVENQMTLAYELVLYDSGFVDTNAPPGMVTLNYDRIPSPLSPLGGGTLSIFGTGGIVDTFKEILNDFKKPGGIDTGTVLKAINLYQNLRDIDLEASAKEELIELSKKKIYELGRQPNLTSTRNNFLFPINTPVELLDGVTATNINFAQGTRTPNYNNVLNANEVVDLAEGNIDFWNILARDFEYVPEQLGLGLGLGDAQEKWSQLIDVVKSGYRNSVLPKISGLVSDGTLSVPRNVGILGSLSALPGIASSADRIGKLSEINAQAAEELSGE